MIFLTTGFSTLENILQLLGVFLLFLFVLAITYFTTRLIGKTQAVKQQNSNIKIIETCRIAPNKYIQIIQIGEKYLAISVCKEQVTFLAELESTQIHILDPEQKQFQFKEILSKIKKEQLQDKKNKKD